MAQSVPQEATQQGFAAEFERLAGRAPTGAELEVGTRLSEAGGTGCSVWAESFLPEGLAHLALAHATAERKRVLFVSPDEDLLEHRQLRLGNRAPCVLLQSVGREPSTSEGLVAWTTPTRLDAAHVSRTFGRTGPDLIVIEDAQAAVSSGHSYRPSLKKLKDIVARGAAIDIVAGAPARGATLRPLVGKELGIKAFSARKNAETSVVESVLAGDSSPILRVEKEESDAIAAVVGPLPRPAVVLCSTPAQADQVYAHLEAEQVPVHRFHSGLAASERARELVHFALPGRRAVMVAVSSFGPSSGFAGENTGAVPEAFGHGYARQDLRSLVHLCAPCSLDQYTQELSLLNMSGNDGARPVALMLYNPAHLALNLALLKRKRPAPESLEVVLEALLSTQRDQWVEEATLDGSGGTSPKSIALVLSFLEDLSVLERQGPRLRVTAGVRELKAAVKQLSAAFEELNDGDGPRLEEVESYALSEQCRSQELSRLLGQAPADAPCGYCDVCDPEGATELAGATKAHAVNSPTIETRPAKRRTPVRRNGAEEEAEEAFEGDLDALEA